MSFFRKLAQCVLEQNEPINGPSQKAIQQLEQVQQLTTKSNDTDKNNDINSEVFSERELVKIFHRFDKALSSVVAEIRTNDCILQEMLEKYRRGQEFLGIKSIDAEVRDCIEFEINADKNGTYSQMKSPSKMSIRDHVLLPLLHYFSIFTLSKVIISKILDESFQSDSPWSQEISVCYDGIKSSEVWKASMDLRDVLRSANTNSFHSLYEIFRVYFRTWVNATRVCEQRFNPLSIYTPDGSFIKRNLTELAQYYLSLVVKHISHTYPATIESLKVVDHVATFEKDILQLRQKYQHSSKHVFAWQCFKVLNSIQSRQNLLKPYINAYLLTLMFNCMEDKDQPSECPEVQSSRLTTLMQIHPGAVWPSAYSPVKPEVYLNLIVNANSNTSNGYADSQQIKYAEDQQTKSIIELKTSLIINRILRLADNPCIDVEVVRQSLSEQEMEIVFPRLKD